MPYRDVAFFRLMYKIEEVRGAGFELTNFSLNPALKSHLATVGPITIDDFLYRCVFRRP
jgi:hypothetical protein